MSGDSIRHAALKIEFGCETCLFEQSRHVRGKPRRFAGWEWDRAEPDEIGALKLAGDFFDQRCNRPALP